jgi:fructokinase
MSAASFVCFGEILWDCLPRGLFLGGAPLNVACHLARLGRPAAVVSAVGADFLGDETLRRTRAAGVGATHLAQLADYPTGVARVQLDAEGRAIYDFAAPAAWDFIRAGQAECAQVGAAAALVYGSLATRHAVSHAALEALLNVPGPLKVMDVNLRPPHDDCARVLALVRHADIVKLNEEELAALTGGPFSAMDDPRPLFKKLRDETGVARWCVTFGSRGAVWWEGGDLVRATTPPVTVRDTVGAGDAFLAALVDGLMRLDRTVKDSVDPAQIQPLLARACRLGALVASRDGACPEYRLEEIE